MDQEILSTKKCPVCKRVFHVMWLSQWVYKRGQNNKPVYICSWKCLREYDKTEEEKRVSKHQVVTKEQKKKAVEIALEGGDPRQFLGECGSKNPQAMWSMIRQELMESDPETFAKIPKAVRKKREDSFEVIGKDEDGLVIARKHEITKPVNYDGFDVTAIRHDELGEFYSDRKNGVMDWRNRYGDEVRLTPEEWRKLGETIPKTMEIFGI